MEQILGPDGRDLIDSGDAVADRKAVAVFLSAFDRAHSIDVESDQATLVVGEDAWPLPIPVVAVNGAWRFDTEAGREEMLARRIGENELAVIQVCQAIVDAQREYMAMTKPGAGDTGVYAQKFLSSPGTRDGLFWMTAAGEPPSPLGPLVADAVAEGYTKQDAGEPFHGYYYRMLTQQGSSAPGGAQSYLEDGRMTGGFAVVAWPASYENSGIMTFLVADQGVVFEQDLGPDTERRAAAITSFDPSSDWVVVAY